jgi:hypothetical protein
MRWWGKGEKLERYRAKSWFTDLLGRWLKVGPEPKRNARPLHARPVAPSLLKSQGSSAEYDAHPELPAQSTVSRAVADHAGKLKMLKGILEFEEGIGAHLDELKSPRELLVLVHETLLFKFLKFRDLGLLNPKSQESLEKLAAKLESFLADTDSTLAAEETMSLQQLSQQNEALKQKLQELHSRYIKTGIISKREEQLQLMVRHLKSRIVDLSSILQTARKRMKTLLSSQELLESLRAKNSLLTSKVEHQAKLLRSITANQPKQKELISTIESLNSENQQLRTQLARKSELIEEVERSGAGGAPPESTLKKHMAENEDLRAQLQALQERFEALLLKRPEESLADHMERLQSENAQLQDLLLSRKTIPTANTGDKPETTESERILEALREENHHLKEHLKLRRDEMKQFVAPPSHNKLFSALMRVKEELRQEQKENEVRLRTFQELKAENEELKVEIRKGHAVTREVRRLRSDLEAQKHLVESLRKTEVKYDSLRKEIFQLEANYKATMKENREISEKLTQLTGEYNLLVNEYENLFGKVIS